MLSGICFRANSHKITFCGTLWQDLQASHMLQNAQQQLSCQWVPLWKWSRVTKPHQWHLKISVFLISLQKSLKHIDSNFLKVHEISENSNDFVIFFSYICIWVLVYLHISLGSLPEGQQLGPHDRHVPQALGTQQGDPEVTIWCLEEFPGPISFYGDQIYIPDYWLELLWLSRQELCHGHAIWICHKKSTATYWYTENYIKIISNIDTIKIITYMGCSNYSQPYLAAVVLLICKIWGAKFICILYGCVFWDDANMLSMIYGYCNSAVIWSHSHIHFYVMVPLDFSVCHNFSTMVCFITCLAWDRLYKVNWDDKLTYSWYVKICSGLCW